VNAESARAAERSHAPALGAAHKLLGRFHVTGVFWYRLHYFSAVHTPAWLQRIVTVTFTAGFLACMPRIRNAVAGINRHATMAPDLNYLNKKIRDAANQYLYEQTRRRPMVLPVVVEV
jgi:hypothetical protein